MSKRAMVLLSGGLDSSMVLVQALRDGCEVAALTVFYGQRRWRVTARNRWRCTILGRHALTADSIVLS